jgi:hypothetical protein
VSDPVPGGITGPPCFLQDVPFEIPIKVETISKKTFIILENDLIINFRTIPGSITLMKRNEISMNLPDFEGISYLVLETI